MISKAEQTFPALLCELRWRTEAGKIKWRDTASEDRFVALLNSGSVEIEKRIDLNEDGVESTWFEATLLNRDGRAVEAVTSSELQDEPNVESDLLPALFQSARAQARRRDDVLGDLFAELSAIPNE